MRLMMRGFMNFKVDELVYVTSEQLKLVKHVIILLYNEVELKLLILI